MKNRTLNIYYLSAVFLILMLNMSFGQSILENVSKPELIKISKEIIEQANTCALITLDAEGHPRVRVMDPFKPDNEFIIWFGTNPKSRKVKQILKDPRVTLYYEAADDSGYVTILGLAEIVDDSREKEKRWKEKWKDFYLDYPEGYTLIKVTPKSMEVISISHNIHGDTITWHPPVVEFD